jgi:hypothetical protein
MSNIESRTEPGTHDRFKMRPLSIRVAKDHIRSEFFSKLLGHIAEKGDDFDRLVAIDLLAYHHGANKPPKLVTATWADHKKAGPLLVATDHRGTFDGKPLRVPFRMCR